MDTLDVKILRELLQSQATSPVNPDFRRSSRSIARKLGVAEDTVRNRVRMFRETHFLEDWHISLNPNLFVAYEFLVFFDVPLAAKHDLIEQISLMPGAFLVSDLVGTELGVVLRCDSERELDKQLALIRKLAKVENLYSARIPYPECRIILSRTDWAILKALRESPRKSQSAVAKEVGLSTRTVKRRLQRMIQERAVFAIGLLRPRALRGSVMAALLVIYPLDRKVNIDRKVNAELDRYIWHITHTLPRHPGDGCPCIYNLMLPNVSEANEILSWAEHLPGVQSARIDFYEDMIFVFDSLDESLTKKLGPTPFAREQPAK